MCLMYGIKDISANVTGGTGAKNKLATLAIDLMLITGDKFTHRKTLGGAILSKVGKCC